MTGPLEEFLAPYPEHVRELTMEARKALHDILQPVSEIYWDATSAVCSGFTYTDHERDNFVNLAVYANHVTLIFPNGVRLADPEQRLRGEGSRVRNLRLQGMETLHDPYVQELIQQAAAMAARPAQRVEPRVIVRVSNGPKRRPMPK